MEIEGIVEALETFACPVHHDPCVVVRYRARVPSFMQRAYSLSSADLMNVVAEASEAVDFLVRDETGRAFARVRHGADLASVHDELRRRHGFELEAQTLRIRSGDRVRVRGRVLVAPRTSPARRADHDIEVEVHEVDTVESLESLGPVGFEG